jgi:DNA-binding Lrp family transcriptional regulator
MMGDWTFFSNYGHVLVCLAKNGDARLRDVAAEVGITERAVQKIVRDMQDAGFLVVSKQGRCNRYRINRRKALRHSLEARCTVGQLLSLISRPGIAPREEEPAAAVAEMAVRPPESKVEASPPKSEPKPKPKPKPKPEPKPEPEPDTASRPLDTRQQGSLF